MNKSAQLNLVRKIFKEELAKRDKITLGEYLYSYHFGEPNMPWSETNISYQKTMERAGLEIRQEILRREKKK